jgi:hypothetical protein
LLRRYGHFGKVPTSAALALRERGALSVGSLRSKIWRDEPGREARSLALEEALQRAWRVSDKICAMFVSALATPGLSLRTPIWDGLDHEHFVVVDSNTDLFLRALRYRGAKTYEARRAFVRRIANALSPAEGIVVSPRIVQQAMYVFMGRTNRRANPRDCANQDGACRRCSPMLSKVCPLFRLAARRSRRGVRCPNGRNDDLHHRPSSPACRLPAQLSGRSPSSRIGTRIRTT